MLEIVKVNDNVIKVIERLCSFSDTEVKVVLYDLKNKKSKVNNDSWYPMNECAINWVEKYYLPKVVDK